MAHVSFTPNLSRHLTCPSAQVKGVPVRKVLQAYFQANPQVHGYVLDDQGQCAICSLNHRITNTGVEPADLHYAA